MYKLSISVCVLGKYLLVVVDSFFLNAGFSFNSFLRVVGLLLLVSIYLVYMYLCLICICIICV